MKQTIEQEKKMTGHSSIDWIKKKSMLHARMEANSSLLQKLFGYYSII